MADRLQPRISLVEDAFQEPDRLTAVDRKLLARLKGLTREALRQELDRWLNRDQIDAVLSQRDLIVGIFREAIAAKGEATVLYRFVENQRTVRRRVAVNFSCLRLEVARSWNVARFQSVWR